MKVSSVVAILTLATLNGAPLVECANLKGQAVHRSRSAELRSLIEDALLQIEEKKSVSQDVSATGAAKGATGVAQGATGVAKKEAGMSTNAAVALAEKKVKGLSSEAVKKVEVATKSAVKQIENKMAGDKAGFGDFKGDADSLFDHDKELALNSESRNPLVVSDETDMRDRDLPTGATGSLGAGMTGVSASGTTGTTGNGMLN